MSIESLSAVPSPDDDQWETGQEAVSLAEAFQDIRQADVVEADEPRPLATREQQLQSLNEVINDTRTSEEVRQSLWALVVELSGMWDRQGRYKP
jgi:hypothetical protein